MLKTEHIKIRVTKSERNFIESIEIANEITISKVLRQLINQLEEDNNYEFKQA